MRIRKIAAVIAAAAITFTCGCSVRSSSDAAWATGSGIEGKNELSVSYDSFSREYKYWLLVNQIPDDTAEEVADKCSSQRESIINYLINEKIVLDQAKKLGADQFTQEERHYHAFRALSPYIYMLTLLPVIRYGFPAVIKNGFAVMCTFGYIVWVDVVILICGLLGALTLGVKLRQYAAICKKTIAHVMPVMVTMSSLLVVSYVMQSDRTGMMNLLASDVARAVGRFYPAAAVLIGASGSFITGTGLGSNIMFADMHMQAAASLGMNPITIFAGQNAGASLGNLICPNNTVAACATVDQIGNENQVMKRTLPAFAIILVTYMALCMLYTCVLFPNYGA